MDSIVYYRSGDTVPDELQELRSNPTIQMYSKMEEDLLEVVTHSNPMLCTFVKLAKAIMAEGSGQK